MYLLQWFPNNAYIGCAFPPYSELPTPYSSSMLIVPASHSRNAAQASRFQKYWLYLFYTFGKNNV